MRTLKKSQYLNFERLLQYNRTYLLLFGCCMTDPEYWHLQFGGFCHMQKRTQTRAYRLQLSFYNYGVVQEAAKKCRRVFCLIAKWPKASAGGGP